MAIEPISSTLGSYQGTTRMTQNANSSPVQNTNSSNDGFIQNTEEVMQKKDSVKLSFTDNQQDNYTNNGINTDEKSIMNAIKQSNEKLKDGGTNWQFGYQRETERVSIKLIDKETNEVIREIPSEDTLILLEKLRNMTGILLDERR